MAASSAKQPKPRGKGRPWTKGQSGNPAGRNAELRPVRELAREFTVEALTILVSLARGAEAESVRRAAASDILDRGWGKPSQPIEGSVGFDGVVKIIYERANPDSPS